jgi:argininosuccinate synthase
MAVSSKNALYRPVGSYEGRRGRVKRVVLLYGGGLDTSTMIPWIKEVYRAEVIALTLDLGQLTGDLDTVRKRALKLGADKALLIDARQEFVDEYISRSIKANGNYQGQYYLSTALARPLLVAWAVKIADREGADAIAHGASGKGNDQVRLDGSIQALNPDLKIIAPAREWGLSKSEQLQYCRLKKVPVKEINEGIFVYDDNMWGITTEGGEIQNAELIPPLKDILHVCRLPEEAHSRPDYLTLSFQRGLPVAIDDTKFNLLDIITSLNKRAALAGVGITYSLEDRIIGVKTRGVYEGPAASTIITAHIALERYAFTRQQNEFKALVDQKWAYLCYGGLWHEPLMTDLNAYLNQANDVLSGQVTLKLYRGNVEVVAVALSSGVFVDRRKTFMENDNRLNMAASVGFIEHYSLQMSLAQRRQPTAFISIGGRNQKLKLLTYVKMLDEAGYRLYATYKTHKFLKKHGIEATLVHKLSNPELKPNIADLIETARFDLIINIPTSSDSTAIRSKEKAANEFVHEKAVSLNIPLISSLPQAAKNIARLTKQEGGAQ